MILYRLLEKHGLQSIENSLKGQSITIAELQEIDNTWVTTLIKVLELNVGQSIRFQKMIKELNNDKDNGISKSRQTREKADYKIKVVIIGESGVGKTSIMKRFTTGSFKASYENTIIADITTQIVYNSQDEMVFLEIWDTAGTERYNSYNLLPLRDANCVIIVYDIAKPKSFDCVKEKYIALIDEHCVDDPVVMLVGNKCDLIKNNGKNTMDGRPSISIDSNDSVDSIFEQKLQHDVEDEALLRNIVPQWKARDLINERKEKEASICIEHVQVSAKSGEQIDQLFTSCGEYALLKIKQRNELQRARAANRNNDTVVNLNANVLENENLLNSHRDQKKKICGCW